MGAAGDLERTAVVAAASETGRPRRIRRSRAKGWRMPPNTVYVGRPTRWGNWWRVGDPLWPGEPDTSRMTRRDAVEHFAWVASISPNAEQWAAPLRGKDLACWCPLDQPCHANVLLELANAAPVANPDPALAYAADESVVGRVVGWGEGAHGRIPVLDTSEYES